MDFKNFDQRHYAFVSPRVGYGEWADDYEQCVPDLLDLKVLNHLESVDWAYAEPALDLACGTGRTGQWLQSRGVATLDGLDITPEMLEQAKLKQIYRHLKLGTVEHTEFSPEQYALITMCLADEHLVSLQGVYQEAFRLAKPGGLFVMVGMHPFFFMFGMPTHFDGKDGQPKAIHTHVHLFSDHFRAAQQAGWRLQESYEGLINDDWIQVKPKWKKHRDCPVNYGYVWVKDHQ